MTQDVVNGSQNIATLVTILVFKVIVVASVTTFWDATTTFWDQKQYIGLLCKMYKAVAYFVCFRMDVNMSHVKPFLVLEEVMTEIIYICVQCTWY